MFIRCLFILMTLMTTGLLAESAVLPDSRISEANPAMDSLPKLAQLWDCVERIPLEVGNLYVFQLNPRFLAEEQDSGVFDDEVLKIFPAVEPFPNAFIDRYLTLEPFVLATLEWLRYKTIKSEGDSTTWTLPDQEALMARWQSLRELHPELPELTLYSGEGVADDLEFAEAYLTYSALLSTGEEFFHDRVFHVIPLLVGMLERGTDTTWEERRAERAQLFVSAKDRVVSSIAVLERQKLECIEDVEIAELDTKIEKSKAFLGFYVDISVATPLIEQYRERLSSFDNFLESIADLHQYKLREQQLKGYWQRRFNSDDPVSDVNSLRYDLSMIPESR